MVKFFSLFCLVTFSGNALSVTLQEIIDMQNSIYDSDRAKQQRLNSDKLNGFKDPKKEKIKPIQSKIVAPVNDPSVIDKKPFNSNKYSAPAKETTNTQYFNTSSDYRQKVNNNAAIGGNVIYQQVSKKRNRFGITLGTRIEGEITRAFSSAETGQVEIKITKSITGKYKSFPVGTLVYGNKAVNGATKRIEIQVSHGITPKPESIEFEVFGYIRDESNVAGVTGIVKEKNQEILQGGVNKGLIAAGRVGIQAVVSNPIAGAALSESTNAMLSDKQSHLDRANNTNIIIYANPQPVTIIIGKTF